MREALGLAASGGLPGFVSLQPHYNLVWREEYEKSKMAFCAENGIAVIPYSPLEGGFLTGKYRRDAPMPKTQRSYDKRKFMTDEGFSVVDALDEIASAHGTTVPAVALGWLLTRDAVVAPIIGANTPEQLADLLPAAELSLAADEVARLDRASELFLRALPE